MGNFDMFIEKTRFRGKCEDCDAYYPSARTKTESSTALRGWRKRHQAKTGHEVKTSITYVRHYPGG